MPAGPGVYIENLAAFRAALKQAEDYAPRQLTTALKRPGLEVVSHLKPGVPVRTGTLQGGYKASVRGSTGSIVNAVPYAGGAEWGARGKWSGFQRYGPPGRFAAKQIDTDADMILREVGEGLAVIFEISGYARP